MEIGTLIIALVVAFVAWKVLTGLVKFAVIGAVILGALWLLSSGALG